MEPYNLPGEIRQVSADRVSLLVARPVQTGTALRVRWGGLVLVGETQDVRHDRGGYLLSMGLWHILFETDDLALCWKVLCEARISA